MLICSCTCEELAERENLLEGFVNCSSQLLEQYDHNLSLCNCDIVFIVTNLCHRICVRKNGSEVYIIGFVTLYSSIYIRLLTSHDSTKKTIYVQRLVSDHNDDTSSSSSSSGGGEQPTADDTAAISKH